MSDPLKPTPSLLAKLGSIVVHIEEGASRGGHAFDYVAAQQLTVDPEVLDWLAGMRAMSLLPVTRIQRDQL